MSQPSPELDLLLHPHRSLSPVGFTIFMAVLAALSFAAGMIFVLHGAWPVMGFFGLDVLLVYAAFRLNYRSARRYETVRLADDTLTVERTDPQGDVQRWEFQPYWLRVEMDEPPRLDSRLVLTSHGKVLEIGRFLTPGEKLEVAHELRAALSRWRNALRPESA